MHWAIAFAHILGAVFAALVLNALTVWVSIWEAERNRKARLEWAALTLGTTVADLDREDLQPKLLQLASDLYSSELLRNRISDLCGWLRRAWGWLGTFAQLGVLVAVIWNTFAGTGEYAPFAWFMVPVALFFWFFSVLFSFVCKVLTGRFPGEARERRKALTATLLQSSRSCAI